MDLNFMAFIIILLAVLSWKIYKSSDIFQLKCIISSVDVNKYCVRDRKKLKESADHLAKVSVNLTKIVEYCKEKYGSSMDFITGDGGFDFSVDFNNQEVHISDLLMAQVFYALIMQKKGGCFVLKIFDCFMNHTLDLLYVLSSMYENVYIVKPYTSRYANSEKYIVCKNFLYSNSTSFYDILLKAFTKMTINKGKQNVSRFLNIPLSYNFVIKIEEYNAIFGQQQIENIHYTITLIENKHKQEKIDNLLKSNISKCIYWCNKHNIPHHKEL